MSNFITTSKAIKPKRIISSKNDNNTSINKKKKSMTSNNNMKEKELVFSSTNTTTNRRKDMDKHVGEYFSSYADDYQNEFVASCDDDQTGIIKHYIKKYSEIVKNTKDANSFAYDFGCGPGLYIKHIADLYNKVEEFGHVYFYPDHCNLKNMLPLIIYYGKDDSHLYNL